MYYNDGCSGDADFVIADLFSDDSINTPDPKSGGGDDQDTNATPDPKSGGGDDQDTNATPDPKGGNTGTGGKGRRRMAKASDGNDLTATPEPKGSNGGSQSCVEIVYCSTDDAVITPRLRTWKRPLTRTQSIRTQLIW